MAPIRSLMPCLVLGASLVWGVAACAQNAENVLTPNETDVAGERADQKRGATFSGQWHTDLCDYKISDRCGTFTVYLVQRGSTICGDHFFATPGYGRMNEGSPRSIIGTVAGDVAEIEITSGRSGAVLRVRSIKKNGVIDWTVIEQIKGGIEDESPLVLDQGLLEREAESSAYRETVSSCDD